MFQNVISMPIPEQFEGLVENQPWTRYVFIVIAMFPLTDMFENRDYKGSTHFFFDIGNGNGLAFFDFPGLDLGPYAEVLGGLHHLAISVPPERWKHLKAKLDSAGVPYEHMSGSSIYFTDPDGTRLELISDPLGEMYGNRVL